MPQPLGVAALSIPRNQQLGQSFLLPNLNRRNSDGNLGMAKASLSAYGKGSFGLLSPKSPMSPKSPFHLPDDVTSPTSMQMAMRHTFSPGSTGMKFTGRMQSQGCWGTGPNKAGVYRKKVPRGAFEPQHVFEPDRTPATDLRRHFERGDLPLSMKHATMPGVEWKVEASRLDYNRYMPIFFDGLLEKVDPFATIALHGLQDMINAARGKVPSLLAPTVPLIIVPLRRALNTRDSAIMCKAINMLQLMLRCDESVGEALVPYYRQILPTFNLYRGNNKNLGDGIDYGQRKKENMGELVHETLELLEKTGGEDAFINIKYMIPTYESCAGF